MTALFAGHTASLIVLGASPLVIPLLALAVKLTFDQTRRRLRDGSRRPRSAEKEAERENRRVVMDERLRAKVEATIWPE